MIGGKSLLSVTAEKYAILYVTSAAVCVCHKGRCYKTTIAVIHAALSLLGFEIDISNHRLFLFEVLILICVCAVFSLPLSPTTFAVPC